MKLPALVTLVALAHAAAAAAVEPTPALDPRIVRLVESVSEERLVRLVKGLEGFHTRHTLSSSDNPERGIGAARQWMLEELRRSSPRLAVSFDSYDLPKQGQRLTRDVELVNVMAVLPGRSPRRIYVSGHYDSVARHVAPRPEPGAPAESASGGFDWTRTDNFAPGANDDGSGTALTLELARVFAASGLEFDATLVFIAFAGEEQGLVGAKLHAQRASAQGLRIDAMFNNDIVGNVDGGSGLSDAGSVRVFSEGPEDSPSRQLARHIRRFATRYVPGHAVRLIARQDRFGRGGDHIAFNQHGWAGVRFTESRENYRRQHTVEDTADGVNAAYLARNARVNAAALAVLALAPPAPEVVSGSGRPDIGRQPSGYDATLRWKGVPGAAGYRVFWRESWTPDWQHELTLGSVTQVTLADVSIDDHVFGVAALGPDGHESLVSAYVNPSRPEVEIQTR